MAGGIHGRGACVAGGHGGGCAWQGGMCGRGACMTGGVHAMHTPPAQTLQDMVGQCAGVTHPTGMHSCFNLCSFLPPLNLALCQW